MGWSLVGVLATSLAGAYAARGATLVEYDLAAANAAVSDSVGVTFVATDIVASPVVSNGTLGDALDAPGTFCHLDWPAGDAHDPSKYYEISIAPKGGFGNTSELVGPEGSQKARSSRALPSRVRSPTFE